MPTNNTMKSLLKINRRHILLAALAFVASAGIAYAAVCRVCNGSGNGPFACFHCKGSGQLNGFTCNFCHGRGSTPCSSCKGTGQK
jgi:DnaJ-class molecular chaperone